MKKIKKLFSLALVGIMALAGCLMLGACVDKDDESNPKINTAMEVFCNINKNYFSISNTIMTNTYIDVHTGDGDRFNSAGQYAVSNADKTIVTQLSDDYIDELTYSSDFVLSICSKLLKCEGFEFGKIYIIYSTDEIIDAIGIEFNDDYLRIKSYYFDSEMMNMIDVYDIYYKDNKPYKMITYSGENANPTLTDDYRVYQYSEYYFSTSADRLYDNYVSISFYSHLSLFIFSEYDGYEYSNSNLPAGEIYNNANGRLTQSESIIANILVDEDSMVKLSDVDTMFVCYPR